MNIEQLILDFSQKENIEKEKILGIDFNCVENGIAYSNADGTIKGIIYRYSDNEEERMRIYRNIKKNKRKRSRYISLKRKRSVRNNPLYKINIFTSNRYRNCLANIQKQALKESRFKKQDSERIANQIYAICKDCGFITIRLENLNLAAMQKFNGSMIEQNNWGQLKECLLQKQTDTIKVSVAPAFEKSTHVCGACGKEREVKLKLRNRIFTCPACGHKENRDLNAARNIAKNG